MGSGADSAAPVTPVPAMVITASDGLLVFTNRRPAASEAAAEAWCRQPLDVWCSRGGGTRGWRHRGGVAGTL